MVPWSDMDKESTVPGVSQANQHFCLFLQLINTILSVSMCANCFIIFHLEKKTKQSISERIKVLLTLLARV